MSRMGDASPSIRHIPIWHEIWFLGNDLNKRFFEGIDPVGKVIQIEGNPYTVVGVAKALGSVFGQSQDNFVMIPIESYFKTYGSRSGIELVAKASSQEHLSEAQDEVRMAAARVPPPKAERRRQLLHFCATRRPESL